MSYCKELDKMRLSGSCCDVTLIAEATRIPAHKLVLSASSPYFMAMFTKFEESKLKTITINEIKGESLKIIIDFIYTAQLHIDKENIHPLLPAANFLQLSEVEDKCWEYLERNINSNNCLEVYELANLYSCCRMIDFTKEYIERHFAEVAKSDNFLALTSDQLCGFIKSDKLIVTKEEIVYESILNWIKKDFQNRCDTVSTLMQYIKFPLMENQFLLQTVEKEALMKSSPQCQEFIVEAKKYHKLQMLRNFENKKTNIYFTKNSPTTVYRS